MGRYACTRRLYWGRVCAQDVAGPKDEHQPGGAGVRLTRCNTYFTFEAKLLVFVRRNMIMTTTDRLRHACTACLEMPNLLRSHCDAGKGVPRGVDVTTPQPNAERHCLDQIIDQHHDAVLKMKQFSVRQRPVV